MQQTLDELAIKHGTDKSSLHHNYCHIYEQYFKHLQHEHIKFAEVGFGGYEYPDRGGQGLRMWREWFTKAEIICVDLFFKINPVPGTEFIQLSQDNEEIAGICKGASVFIDDGSHINPLTIRTFELVWPVLAPGAFYVIEDIESSWCPADGWAKGCSDPYNYEAPTAKNLGVELISAINAQYVPNFAHLYKDIQSVHFHKNVIIIKKR